MMRLHEDWLSILPAGFVTARLLISPRSSERIVQGAVDNYALPESAARVIDRLPDDVIEKYFGS